MTNQRQKSRRIRQARVRKKVRGVSQRPRLSVFRSANHIYAQLIDDQKGITLAAASTLSEAIQTQLAGQKKIAKAKIVGLAIGAIAKDKGVTQVVFDRNGFLYHGRVKALSEGAREAGLEF
ncbi:MAG: 50S ribosomal protein L18 [Deltaproteobacteria bacterium]|nr:50S ribosomal protein L18 [Deltaproteobacteria bacterium]